MVTCRYSQIPRTDFNDSVAPVVINVSFRVILIAKLIWGLQACIVDEETTFQHDELQEEIYTNIPEGLNTDLNNCL